MAHLDFAEALKLIKTFSACHPRIYKEFSGFPQSEILESERGYVLFVEASLSKDPCYCKLRDFAEANDLSMTPFGKYMMVSGEINR